MEKNENFILSGIKFYNDDYRQVAFKQLTCYINFCVLNSVKAILHDRALV